MRSLHEFQQTFNRAIWSPASGEDALLAATTHGTAEARRRLGIYRRNVLGAMRGALGSTYPVVERVVGREFFAAMADHFVLTHPSVNGDLNEFGAGFADFIASFVPAAGLPYLSAVAALEWQVQQVYYAPDGPPPDLTSIASVAADDWPALQFGFHSAWARLDSSWPLAQIWRVNQPDYVGGMEVDEAPGQVLVWRQNGNVNVINLLAGEALLFDTLVAGMPLSQAFDRASKAQVFDLAAALAALMERGLVISAKLSGA